MRCLSCRYDLRELAEDRCPECGRLFDPEDPETFYTPPNRTSAIRLLLLILCCHLPIIWALLAFQRAGWRTATAYVLIGLFALSWLGTAILLGVIVRRRRREARDTVP